jgi:Lrp/AsnC family leucine-responsive transcriptional regulator
MLDRFDLALLNQIQSDASQTAEQLSKSVPLSPSAIARRLRRLRRDRWIVRTMALLSGRLTNDRLRALIFVTLSEHADHSGKAALQSRLLATPEVQFVYDLAGPIDIVLMFDCPNMARFNELTDEVLTADSTVRRYETHFIKREVKFEPFVQLAESG